MLPRNTQPRYRPNRSSVAARLRRHEHAELGVAAGGGRDRVQPGERAGGQRQPGREREQAASLVPAPAAATRATPNVTRRLTAVFAHRGQQQR